jgi:hypothetical protein
MRLLLAFLLLGLAAEAGAQPATRFDGTWDVTIICAEAGSARGYTLRFPAEVRGGTLSGGQEAQGPGGSLRLEGPIQPDGSAVLAASGVVGRSEVAAGRVPPGSPYRYRVEARFADRSGTGRRVGGRSCDFSFSRR